jgi:hypothetical protein
VARQGHGGAHCRGPMTPSSRTTATTGGRCRNRSIGNSLRRSRGLIPATWGLPRCPTRSAECRKVPLTPTLSPLAGRGRARSDVSEHPSSVSTRSRSRVPSHSAVRTGARAGTAPAARRRAIASAAAVSLGIVQHGPGRAAPARRSAARLHEDAAGWPPRPQRKNTTSRRVRQG